LLACIKITAVQLHPMLDCCGWLPGHCKVLQGDVWKLLHELSVVDGGFWVIARFWGVAIEF